MTIAVLSDIHGNNAALEAILEKIQRHHVDRIVVAGDIIGGPEPNKTIELIRDASDYVIRGNQEQYLCDQLDDPDKFQGVRWALVRAINRRIAPANIDYLRSLPKTISMSSNGHDILIAHSTIESTNEVFFPEQDETRTRGIVGSVGADVFICGHSHRQWMIEHNGTIGINPGSVGVPISDDQRAQYALVRSHDEIEVELFRVPYDRKRFDRIFSDAEFFDEIGPIGKAAYHTFRTGKGIMLDFMSFARSHAANDDGGRLTDDVLLLADQLYDWNKH